MTLDVMSNSPFFTSKCKAIWKENPVVNQKSLRPFFHVPLHLFLILSFTAKSNEPPDIYMYTFKSGPV